MCEFTVYDSINLSQRIAKDIVKARIRDGTLALSEILGETLTLDDSVIFDVDVSKERMVVSRSPVAGSLLKLIELTTEFENKPSAQLAARIADLWESVKAKGDSMVRWLKAKTAQK